MRKIKEKLISNKGETLAETLVAALIAALGLLLLASMIMNATHIVEKSQATMKEFYASISEMETKESGDKVTKSLMISVTDEAIIIPTVEVDVYTRNGLVSYEKKQN